MSCGVKGLFVAAVLVGASAFGAAAELGPSQDISFVADIDGSTQRYVLRLPENFNAGAPHHLLIALHGHGSDRWQYATATVWPEIVATRDVAAKHQMIFVSPDYRAPTSWMGPSAEADVVQIINDLKTQYLVDKVFICGASMGGTSALTFTAIHPELIDGVISMNGTANHFEFENFQEYIAASFGGTKSQIPTEYKKRSSEYWPERFTMPVGITASALDTVVPPESVVRLANILYKINPDVSLIYDPDLGHSTSYENAEVILEFVIDKVTTVSNDLVANGSFETGTGVDGEWIPSGWSVGTEWYGRQVATSEAGIIDSSDGNSHIYLGVAGSRYQDVATIAEGVTYDLTADLSSYDGTGSLQISLQIFDGTTATTVWTSDIAPPPVGVWTSVAGSYTGTAGTAGDTLRVLISGADNGGFIDNVALFMVSGYSAFSTEYNLQQSADGDDDADGLSNLYEYALGGNPTNGVVDAIPSTYNVVDVAGSDVVEYVYPRRKSDSALNYYLELADKLVTPAWTNDGYTVMPLQGDINADFEAVTNQTPTAGHSEEFIRLIIEQQ